MIFWWIRMTLANGHQMCEFDLADPRLLTCFCLLRDVKPVMVWRNNVKFPPWGPGWVGSWWMIIWGWCDEVPPGQMNLIFSIQITTTIISSIFLNHYYTCQNHTKQYPTSFKTKTKQTYEKLCELTANLHLQTLLSTGFIGKNLYTPN